MRIVFRNEIFSIFVKDGTEKRFFRIFVRFNHANDSMLRDTSFFLTHTLFTKKEIDR